MVVRAKRQVTHDAKILEEFQGWVGDIIHSCTQYMKYFKIAETYWIVKTLVFQVLEKNKE